MIDKPVNPNYCATVVRISKLIDLPNCDNVKAAIIFNNSVIVGKDTQIGDLGLYFPPETQLSEEFLSNNNLYQHQELNKDKEKKGYFGDNGRVKIAKFRGNKSEGIWLVITCLDYIFNTDKYNSKHDPNSPVQSFYSLTENTDFDKIDGHLICKKYVVLRGDSGVKKTKSDKKIVKKFDRLVENQFRLMFETENFRRNNHLLNPNDIISITNKMHGTSSVTAKILTRKPLNIFKQVLKKFIPEINDTVYDIIYSSRKVVKNKYINIESNNGYYNYDLWKEVADTLKDYLEDGITIYSEIVGQLPTGGWIQKNYDYGTRPNHYEIYVYRITFTNPAGKMIELSWPQIKDYCNKYGIKYVQEFYYGKAKDYCPSIPTEQHWQVNFLNKLEKDFILDRDCPLCINTVPEEGIVISRETSLWERENWKLKNFKFLKKESDDLDKGEIDIESEQSNLDKNEEN